MYSSVARSLLICFAAASSYLWVPVISLAGETTAPQALNAAEDPLPQSVDLREFCPPVIDQKELAIDLPLCAAYYQRGWYAKRDGYYPEGNGKGGKDGFSGMYLYSQIAAGTDMGTTIEDPYAFMWAQGVASRQIYGPRDEDFTAQPNARHRKNAQRYQIKSWEEVRLWEVDAKEYIKRTLAGGDPLMLAIRMYTDFLDLNSTNFHYTRDLSGEFLGGHAIVCLGYDEQGIWIVNTFGTEWGLNGFAHISWDTVLDIADNAVKIEPMEYNRFRFRSGTRSASPGSNVSLSGSQFPPNSTVQIHWDDDSSAPLRTVRTNRNGEFATRVKIPEIPGGYHRLLAVVNRGGNVKTVATEMHVIPRLAYKKEAVSRTHTKGEIVGSGFLAGSMVELRWNNRNGEVIASITADEDGRFTYNLDADLPSPGKHKVAAMPEGYAETGQVSYYFSPYFFEPPFNLVSYTRVTRP